MTTTSEVFPFVLLGTGGNFTTTVLEQLLNAGLKPRAYLQSGAPVETTSARLAGIPIEASAKPVNSETLCHHHQIEVHTDSLYRLESKLDAMQVDCLLCACWPALISTQAIAKVGKVALNLHPSLLPAYRGRDPIGAQLLAGAARFGISLHLLDEIFDHGHIVAQQPFEVGQDREYRSIETAAAKLGAELFIEAVESYETPGWKLKPQDE